MRDLYTCHVYKSRKLGLGALAELGLEDLAARVQRDRVDDLDVAGDLVVRHLLAAPRDELIGCDRRVPAGDHERIADFTEARVGDADDRDLPNGRMLGDHVLDLGGGGGEDARAEKDLLAAGG